MLIRINFDIDDLGEDKLLLERCRELAVSGELTEFNVGAEKCQFKGDYSQVVKSNPDSVEVEFDTGQRLAVTKSESVDFEIEE